MNRICNRIKAIQARGLWADDLGTIAVEYTVLLSLVAVGCAAAVVGLGAPLVRLFLMQEAWILLALP